jgi:RNA polymerase sigma-70 factor (ECF subfamily)
VLSPASGLEAVAAIQKLQPIDSYYLLYAILGEFEEQLKHFDTAAEHFRKALEFSKLRSEQSFLSHRVHDCEAAHGHDGRRLLSRRAYRLG